VRVTVDIPAWFMVAQWCGLGELLVLHSGGCRHDGIL
jgi:hypothetical protein